MKQAHNFTWFKNRIGKTVFCDDHRDDEECDGIVIETEIMAKNLYESQNNVSHHTKFDDKQ